MYFFISVLPGNLKGLKMTTWKRFHQKTVYEFKLILFFLILFYHCIYFGTYPLLYKNAIEPSFLPYFNRNIEKPNTFLKWLCGESVQDAFCVFVFIICSINLTYKMHIFLTVHDFTFNIHCSSLVRCEFSWEIVFFNLVFLSNNSLFSQEIYKYVNFSCRT